MIRVENLSRRGLLKGAAGSGLLLGIYIAPFAYGADAPKPEGAAKPAAQGADFTPSAYIALDPSGAVTFTINRSEMGQAIKTSLAMILADEMGVTWQKVTVRQAEGDPKYGDQDTDRSRSMRLFYTPMRQAGAAAKQMLEAAAAQTWRAAIKDCRAVDHEVIHLPTGRVLTYGQLAKTASALPPPAIDKLKLQEPSSRRYIGKPIPNITPEVDLPAILHGRAVFGADVVLPGMRHASIERCPVYGGKAKAFDAKAPLTVKGVEKVVEIPASPVPTGHFPLGGIAIIATNSWAAQEGRKKLAVEWDLGPNATYDSTAYRKELEEAVRKPGKQVRNQGNFDPAYAVAAKKLPPAEYYVPAYAHAMMEPPVAVAAPESGGRIVIFAPTQSPQFARATVALYLGMKDADISVRPTLLGGAFGRKSMHDFVCEAAWLAKNINAPVKVTWTREDDIRHDYYHAACAQRIEGGIDKNGVPVAWRHRTAFPAFLSTFQANATTPDAAQLSEGFTDMPYLIANVRCEVASAPSHTRIGWMKSDMNIPHAFAVCSFIDELAVLAGKDSANYIFTHLAGPRRIDMKAAGIDYKNYDASIDDYPVDVGRLQAVLQLVMDRSGWGDPLLPRQGRGVAVHRSFLSYVAAVVVVTIGEDGQVAIPQVHLAIDCGTVVSPDRVKAQMESAVMFGIGLTLYGNLTFKEGAAEQSNFDNYRLARMNVMPQISIYVVPSTAPPTGAGDPGVPVMAPAICNAIAAATGKRIRSLPVDTSLLKS